MAINRVSYRKNRIEVRKRWPDSSEFRRFYPNMSLARRSLARIETVIIDGSWRTLREELSGKENQERLTVAKFSVMFLETYAKPRLRSWDRYALSFESLNRHLGHNLLREFRRGDLHNYVQHRIREVAPGTVNKDIAAIKKMFSFALETGILEHHPLVRFPTLKVQEIARRNLRVEEFRALVDSMDRLEIAAMTAVIGETGIRKGEALTLERDHVNLSERFLTVGRTKNRKVRHIPLSDFAIEWIQRLVHHIDCPYVFVRPSTGKRWINPEKAFKRGAKKAGLDWVGFHDLRRFRATQWLRLGVDVRTVKELLGHQDVKTTMRYTLFVSDHAVRSIRDAQSTEVRELETERERLEGIDAERS